jgi:hypothetical protein
LEVDIIVYSVCIQFGEASVRVDNSTGKGTSGMDKFSSEVHRVHMELGGKLLKSLNGME